MAKRIITGLILAAIGAGAYLIRLFFAPVYFEFFLWAVTAVCAYEVATVMGERTLPCQKWIAIIISSLLGPVFFWLGFTGAAIVAVFGLAAQLSVTVFRHKDATLEGTGLAVLTTFYPSALLLAMTAMNNMAEYSFAALLLTVGCATLSDVFAFVVGSIVKGPKLCPNLSPQKTVAGAVGGIFGGLVAAFAVYAICGIGFEMAVPKLWFFPVVGVLASLATEFGDLVESALKRRLNVKDMSNLLPGHGGFMDRVDGFSFAAPLVYICFVLYALL